MIESTRVLSSDYPALRNIPYLDKIMILFSRKKSVSVLTDFAEIYSSFR